MPGDAELVEEFAASLQPSVLGDLFEKMVEEMKLAGELGSLLKIEESIAIAVKEAAEANQQGNLFDGKFESQDFWDTAEERIVAALGSFVESAAGARGVRRQLFAGDAAQGVAFVELMRKRFDAVLMNPPFGAPAATTRRRFRHQYPAAGNNLYAAFSVRAANLAADGRVGAITDSTFLKQPTFRRFREELLGTQNLSSLVALGWDVLDANVQTAMYVTGDTASNGTVAALSVQQLSANKDGAVREAAQNDGYNWLARSLLSEMPKSVLVPDVQPDVIRTLGEMSRLGSVADLPWGNGANDSELLFRLRWEVPAKEVGSTWALLTNGGHPSLFYRENYLLCLARLPNGESAFDAEFKAGADKMYDASAKHAMGRPGLTYPKRSNNLHFAALSSGHVVTPEGKGLFVPADDHDQLWFLCGVLNSSFVSHVAQWLCGPHKQKGDVALLPLPELSRDDEGRIADVALSLSRTVQQLFSGSERSVVFRGMTGIGEEPPGCLREVLTGRMAQLQAVRATVSAGLRQIDEVVAQSLPNELRGLAVNGPLHESVAKSWSDEAYTAFDVASYLIGIAFGRWRTSPGAAAPELHPFESCPRRPPASAPLADTPEVPELFVDDPGHSRDFTAALRHSARALWGGREADLSAELVELTCDSETGGLAGLSRTGALFEHHLKRYRAGRRKAPIYWQLATPSASYSVWCFYHRLTRDTLFRVANDHVTPKVDHEERKLNTLRQEAGSAPSSKQRKEIDAQETFVAELRAFLAEVKRIAPMWNPNLNDGVIINFAPLWRLVPQNKAWQKECKKVWHKLVKGDYDWAHLAMRLWPERVVPKCRDDRSLAIAHGLDEEFWFEDDGGKKTVWKKRNVSSPRMVELIAARSSTTVKAALDDLLSAPAPAGKTRSRRRKVRS